MNSSLINDDDLVWARFDIQMTGTPLTGPRSLIARVETEVETRRSSQPVLSMAAIKWLFKIWTKLTPAAGKLTGGRSLVSKTETEVETPRLWAVCSITISKYLKMGWAKLNTHTDASGNLCACNRIRVTSRDGWRGACHECRFRSWWHRPMHWTQRRFLGLENFPINALHIVQWYRSVNDQSESELERSLDYISGPAKGFNANQR